MAAPQMSPCPGSNDVTIRTRHDTHLDSCIALLDRVHQRDGYPGAVVNRRLFLQPDTLVQAWVAESNGNVIGHVAVGDARPGDIAVDVWRQRHPTESIVTLERLFLDPEYRGIGVAGRLIECTVQWSHDNGYQRLVLFALKKDMKAARMYQRLGWEHFGTDTFHYGHGEQMEALCFSSPGQA